MHCKVIVSFILDTQLRDALSAAHAMSIVVCYRSAHDSQENCTAITLLRPKPVNHVIYDLAACARRGSSELR